MLLGKVEHALRTFFISSLLSAAVPSDTYMATPGDDVLDREGGQPGNRTALESAGHWPTVEIAEVSKGDTQLVISKVAELYVCSGLG